MEISPLEEMDFWRSGASRKHLYHLTSAKKMVSITAAGSIRTPDEKELIKVAWSPKVKTDESFAIVVNSNRVKETD